MFVIRFLRVSAALVLLLLAACGGSSSSPSTTVTGFSVTPGDAQVVATWDAQPGQYYDLYYKAGSTVSLTDYDGVKLSVNPPYTLNNLTNQTQYSFILTATNSGGVRGSPTPVFTTTLGASGTGLTWTVGSSLTTGALGGVAYGGNTFVAVGESASILSAPFGPTNTGGVSSWSSATVPLASTAVFTSVLFDGTQFVAMTVDGSIVTSNDTVTWKAATSVNSGQKMYGIAYGNGTYVAVGLGGTIMTNNTAVLSGAWKKQDSTVSQDLYNVAYVNGDFIAVGYQGLLLTSHDGVTWVKRNSNVSQNLSAVAYGAGTYVAVGGAGTIISSSDGATWSAESASTSNNLYSVTFGGNDLFVAVGQAGTIAFRGAGASDSWTLTTAGSADLYKVTADTVFVAVGALGANVTGR